MRLSPLILVCFLSGAPAMCFDVRDGAAVARDPSPIRSPARVALGLTPSQPPAASGIEPWEMVQAAHTDLSDGCLPPAGGSARTAQQHDGTSTSTSSNNPASVIKRMFTHRNRPHLIELSSANWRPLKPKEKFELFWRDMLSWETHLSLGFDGAIAFATDDRAYLGDGFQGWAKRYGINVLDEANFTFLEAYFFPTLFHTESRYIPMNTGTTLRRLGYALTRVVVARSDKGGNTFNSAKILGAFTAAALSNAYNSPATDTPNLEETLARAGISLASDSAFNIFKEFWPDFARKVKLNVWIANIVRSSIRDVIVVN